MTRPAKEDMQEFKFRVGQHFYYYTFPIGQEQSFYREILRDSGREGYHFSIMQAVALIKKVVQTLKKGGGHVDMSIDEWGIEH